MSEASGPGSGAIRVEHGADGAVWVTLDRPEAKNALSRAVNLELRRLAVELGQSRAVRAVVLTGANGAFSAGADLKERRGVAAADTGPYVDAIAGAITAWAEMPRPTIAAMSGPALGGGLELALACDFRIAAEDAVMGLSEVRLGIMPGAGGTQRLTRLLGVSRAKELVMTGRRIDARRALEIGLVSRVVPAAELRAAAEELAGELSACAPLSVSMAKQAIDQGVGLPLDQALALERRCYEVTLASEDRNEGLRAFAEKRPPRFTGD
ncbi:MAG TPA: enoyl-CoA hydratase-related protein [Kofleriaceae bacterium]|nr:enoyl-CoA hydratase-related protein [Kofleriaceae bacterium]